LLFFRPKRPLLFCAGKADKKTYLTWRSNQKGQGLLLSPAEREGEEKNDLKRKEGVLTAILQHHERVNSIIRGKKKGQEKP